MTISDSTIRILKKASCPTLTGKSKLTYHIGCSAESQIYFRIHANDGGGFFSREWVAWQGIRHHLQKVPKSTPITSIALHRLFKGKSVNTPSFLLAVLKHEGLVRPLKGKKRSHELVDPEAFLARVDKLISANAGTTTGKTTKKAPARKTTKKTTSRKTTKKAPVRKTTKKAPSKKTSGRTTGK